MAVQLAQIFILYGFSYLIYYLLRALGNRELASIMRLACWAIMVALGVEVIAEAIHVVGDALKPLADGLKGISDSINQFGETVDKVKSPIRWFK